jgi:hypothetical protein
MIKFFRRIRQNLLNEGKTTKYFKYAIGEIILVVIGILIALQINNWNEYRKDRVKEQVLLTQLKREYNSNLIQLNEKIEMRKIMIQSASRLLYMIDHKDQVVPDSISYYLSFTRMSPTFDPIKNDLINSAKLEFIQNEDLKTMLTAWGSNEEQLEEAEEKWLVVLDDIFTPLLYEYNLVRELVAMNYNNGSMGLMSISTENIDALKVGKSNGTGSFMALLNDPKLESYLASAVGVNSYNNIESMTLKNHISEILNTIEKELK